MKIPLKILGILKHQIVVLNIFGVCHIKSYIGLSHFNASIRSQLGKKVFIEL